jgi:hypothetical protein
LFFSSLVEKERLLGELMRSQKEFESMKHSFESKLQVCLMRASMLAEPSHARTTGNAKCNRPYNSRARSRSRRHGAHRTGLSPICTTLFAEPVHRFCWDLTFHQSVEGATASERERFTLKLKALEGRSFTFSCASFFLKLLAGELVTLKRQLRDHERLVQFRAQGATKIKLLQTEVANRLLRTIESRFDTVVFQVDKLRTAKEDLLR